MNMTPGRYNVKAVDSQLSQASTGTPQVEVVFEVIDGEYEGETISYFGFLTDAALPWTMKALRTAGFEGNDISDLSSVNGECSITVKEDTYDGVTRLKVEWVNELGGLRSRPMDDAASFAKQMAKKIAALEAGKPKKNQSIEEALEDDDIPFNV